MNILNRVGHAISSAFRRSNMAWSDESWWQFHGGGMRTVSGVTVTEASALTLTAAYAAINCLSTDIAALPLPVYRRRKDGGRDIVRDHPAYDLLNVSPDEERTAMRFRQALIARMLGWGNGCEEITWDNGGRLVKLSPLEASTLADRDPETKGLIYRTPDKGSLPSYKVLHIAGLGYDGINGYSPIRLAREAVAIGKAAEKFGAAYYGNGTRTGGWIKLPAGMKPEAVQNFRKSIEAVHRGPEAAHKVGFLEPGMEFISGSIAPDEAQFLATRKFQVIEIARMFRVPLHKLMDLDNAHYASMEESNLDYLMTTIMPWCEQIEQAMNMRLFSMAERKQGYFIEHNMGAFFRGNMQARAEFYTKMMALGVYTPNIISQLENLEPIGPAGDVRLVPLNMTTLENAGKPQPAAPDKAKRKRTALMGAKQNEQL